MIFAPLGEQQRLHPAAVRAGLFGDEHVAEHFFGERNRFVHRRRDLHAALKTGFESALAASAGVDLRFDDDSRAAAGENLFRRRADLRERRDGDLQRNGDAVLGEQLFGLILVDVHFR